MADAPATLPGDSNGRSYIVNRLAPGTTIQRRGRGREQHRSIADVAVYVAAASLSHGTFSFARGHVQNELSSWTLVDRQTLRLEPGAAAFETVTIAVPGGLGGRALCGRLGRGVSPAQAAGGVTLVNRVGVRMYLSSAQADWLRRTSSVAGSTRFALRRVGCSLWRASKTVEEARSTSGTADAHARSRRTSRRPVCGHAPARSRARCVRLATVRLDRNLPLGPWRARLSLTSGFIQREAVATLTFPALVAAAKPSSSRHTLIAVGILLALLLAAGAAAGTIRHRRVTITPQLT